MTRGTTLIAESLGVTLPTLPVVSPHVAEITSPETTFDELEEWCFFPNRWSYQAQPVARQSDPKQGLLQTRYLDSRTIRVHTLTWLNPPQGVRQFLRALFRGPLAVPSKRFKTQDSDGRRFAGIVLGTRSTLISGLSTGQIRFEIQEELGEQELADPATSVLYLPMFWFTPGVST